MKTIDTDLDFCLVPNKIESTIYNVMYIREKQNGDVVITDRQNNTFNIHLKQSLATYENIADVINEAKQQ